MFKKVSVLVPTRKRPGRLGTLFYSYLCTTACVSEMSELVFRVDDDDEETIALLSSGGHRMVIGPRLKGYESLPTFFNELVQAASGDVLMCGNDDMVFKTTDWAPAILREANKYADGLFDIGVHTYNETHYPFATVSRKAVDAMGFLFDPRIFWGDIFLRDVMSVFGRCVMLPDVEIDHDWVGHRPDHVFNEGENARRGSWMERHGEAVNEAVEKLRALVQ